MSGDGEDSLLAVSGEIDLSNRESLISAALAALENTTSVLTLDLAGVQFCDSSGVSGLLAIYRIAASDGKRVIVINPQRQIVQTLTIAGLLGSLTGRESDHGGLIFRRPVI